MFFLFACVCLPITWAAIVYNSSWHAMRDGPIAYRSLPSVSMTTENVSEAAYSIDRTRLCGSSNMTNLIYGVPAPPSRAGTFAFSFSAAHVLELIIVVNSMVTVSFLSNVTTFNGVPPRVGVLQAGLNQRENFTDVIAHLAPPATPAITAPCERSSQTPRRPSTGFSSTA